MSEVVVISNEPLPRGFQRFRALAGMAGAAGLVLCCIGWLINRDVFYRAYLIAYMFFLGITLGSLAWVMMHHLVGGGWGRAIQRIGEAASLNLVLMAVLFIPIAIGAHSLYPWADPVRVSHDAMLRHKAPYLNFNFW